MCSFLRYPIISPRDKCAGDLGQRPGVRSYGLRPADERYDVYCYIDGLKGNNQASDHSVNQDKGLHN